MAKSKWSKEKKNDEVTFEIVEELGKLGKTSESGWTLEVNVVSWNDGTAKIDIRPWNEDHTKCTKGIRLNDDEADKLGHILVEAFK